MKDIENVAAHISNANLVHPLILSESDLGIVRGITKRELFAAMNLQALLTCEISFNDAVIKSVDLADKLIEELGKKSEERLEKGEKIKPTPEPSQGRSCL